MDFRGLGWSVCVAVVAAQHGSERYVVPSTLFFRLNMPLQLVHGEDHGEVPLALLASNCFVKCDACETIRFMLHHQKSSIEYFL